jgi:hypothetical protein
MSVFSIFALYGNMHVLLSITIFIFGFFGMAAYAISLELSAECTHPVIETTPAGRCLWDIVV